MAGTAPVTKPATVHPLHTLLKTTTNSQSNPINSPDDMLTSNQENNNEKLLEAQLKGNTTLGRLKER